MLCRRALSWITLPVLLGKSKKVISCDISCFNLSEE
jgi:hypothetical protein